MTQHHFMKNLPSIHSHEGMIQLGGLGRPQGLWLIHAAIISIEGRTGQRTVSRGGSYGALRTLRRFRRSVGHRLVGPPVGRERGIGYRGGERSGRLGRLGRPLDTTSREHVGVLGSIGLVRGQNERWRERGPNHESRGIGRGSQGGVER